MSESYGRVQNWNYQPCQAITGTGSTFSLVFCQHRGCSLWMPAQDRHLSTNKNLRGHQGQRRQLHFCRCSSTMRAGGSCGSFPVIPWLIKEQGCPPGTGQGNGHRALGRRNGHRALGRGNAPRALGRRNAPRAPLVWAGSTQPQPLTRLSVNPAQPQGGPEPPHQQLLLHFPSSQAHFRSLVHRDYFNSNQNREEKAPQNARGTKLYKG